MKNIIKLTCLLLTVCGFAGCTGNFDEYNTDPYALYKGDPAVLIPTMLDAMMYVQQNDSQMVDQMVGSLGGYFTLSNRWGGQNFDTFNASDAWNATPYNTSVRGYLRRSSTRPVLSTTASPSGRTDRIARDVKPGAKIAVLGMSFKANIDDTRESPSVLFANILKSRGYEVLAWRAVHSGRRGGIPQFSPLPKPWRSAITPSLRSCTMSSRKTKPSSPPDRITTAWA